MSDSLEQILKQLSRELDESIVVGRRCMKMAISTRSQTLKKKQRVFHGSPHLWYFTRVECQDDTR